MRFIIFFLLITLTVNVFAQSGKITADVAPVAEISVKQMFDEVNSYTKNKFAEFSRNKVPFNEKLRQQTFQEQKQLAARYASVSTARKTLAGEDFYFLGLLHWFAENADGAAENFAKFLKTENIPAEKAQASRSFLSIINARRKKFAEAEKMLGEYIHNQPLKSQERARIEGTLAQNYQEANDIPKAAAHADDFLAAQKAAFIESKSYATEEMLDAQTIAFKIYRENGSQQKADTVLTEMRRIAAAAVAPASYFYAVDNLIKYQIETGRKPNAFQTFQNSLTQVAQDFAEKPPQNYVLERLRKHEPQYRMLGENAPELLEVDEWFPGKTRTLASLRGSVVLLDFWATWCSPCIKSMPSLVELHRDFSDKGLVILGLTRYYQSLDNVPAEDEAEISTLKKFKGIQKLPYDFLVSKGQANQINYGATALPTTALIDKKGVIRYLETGTSATREAEIREMVEKLLAEK